MDTDTTILENVDLAGMNPRTVSFDRRGEKTIIIVVIPLNYLRGLSNRCYNNLRFSLAYRITPEANHANEIDHLKIATVNRDYNVAAHSVEMYPNSEIIGSVTSAMLYFRYVRLHLENNKTNPLHYEDWVIGEHCNAVNSKMTV